MRHRFECTACCLAIALGLGCRPTPAREARPAGPDPLRPSTRYREATAKLAEPLVTEGWITGASVALLHDGGTELYGFGRVADGGGVPGPDTIFEIGSVTKVFTALLLAELARRGRVRLDQPVVELLPAEATVPSREGRVIRLEHLATHTAGLPRLPEPFRPARVTNPYVDFGEAQLVAALRTTALRTTPGVRYAYSNLGAGLLGHALARRAGRTYEQLVREVIAGPLGMRDTGLRLTPEQRARFAQGHDADGRPVPAWDFDALAGAGALRSTARDLARFVRAQLGEPPTPLLSAMRATHAIRHEGGEAGRVALGWHVGGKGGLWHNGGTFGAHSFVAVSPARRVGVVVLANTSADVVDGLAARLMQLLTGEPPRPFRLPPWVRLPAATLDRYVGAYEIAPGATIVLRRDGPRLWARISGQPELGLYAADPVTFHYRAVAARVTFPAGEGPAPTLTIHQAGKTTAARRSGL